jgi:ADP-heptose:LPS heptosyltransferase
MQGTFPDSAIQKAQTAPPARSTIVIETDNRIAVFFPGALGDFICLLPALQILAEGAQVELFTKMAFAGIVPRHIRVRALERYEINRLFVTGAACERRLGDFFSPYRRVYSWMGSGEPVFRRELRALAPGRVRLFAFHGADAAMHQSDYYLSCVETSRKTGPAVTIPLQPEALQWRKEFWQRHGLQDKALLVMAPGSGSGEKNWPAEYFFTVGRWWRERTGGAVIALFGPVEEECGGFAATAEEFIAARSLSLAQVAALLSGCNLYIGNDSGITHLAAGVGVPTVALFGPSDPRRWAPRGPKVLLLRRRVACSPCAIAAMKACAHHRCLHQLVPSRIIGALEKFNEVATLTRVGAGITVQTCDH